MPDALHYDEFYGLADRSDGRRVGWVHGNCQAESLRQQLDGEDLRTVRVPPVHELGPEDLPHLDRLLRRTDVWVSQPVRDAYRGLPLGVAEITARLPSRTRVVRLPVVRFAGLYPTQAIIRPPEDPSLVPPVVPYHDLGTLAAARDAGRGSAAVLTVERVRAVAEHSRRELRRREEHHATVRLADLFDRPDFSLMRTINHPGNAVWLAAAVRVRAALGLDEDDVTPLSRPLLDHIHAPRHPVVAEAFELDPSTTSGGWRVGDREVSVHEVHVAHLAWYAAHPGAVEAGLARHREVLDVLGLLAPAAAPR